MGDIFNLRGNHFEGQTAVGHRAHAGDVNVGAATVAQAGQILRELRAGIHHHAGDLPEAAAAAADVTALEQELTRPDPRGGLVSRRVAELTAHVAPVTALAELAIRITNLLSGGTGPR